MLKFKLKQLTLFVGDIIFLHLALYLTLLIRYWQIPGAEAWEKNNAAWLPVFGLWFIILYINNLYSLKIFAQKNRFLESFFKSILAAFVVSISYFYLFPYQDISPKTNLVIFSIIFAGTFIIWRYSFLLFIKNRLPKINLGIIGYNDRVNDLVTEINRHPHLGYEIKFILLENSAPEIKLNDSQILIFREDDNLEELISKYKISSLILEKSLTDSPDLQKKLFNCLPLGINYITFASFYERITGRIPLEVITKSWFLENLNLRDKIYFEFIKRIYDLVLGILIFVVSLPAWPLIALIIRLDSRGPIFFQQIRLGKNNIPFTIIKFRTMVIDNNDYSFTTKGDKRITKPGSFLRKTRIDEIPQILNIIKGDMSFIGPRPERLEFTAALEQNIPYYSIRTLVKPGITGWDQVSGEYHSATEADTYKKLQHDLFYIKNRSLFLDLTIILKTIKTVFSYHGR